MVTKTQIADEMQKLEDMGLEPSADRLLQRTGGSKTKVLELRNEVRAEREALERNGADLPEHVRAVAFDLVRLTQKALEDSHDSAVNVLMRRAGFLADANEALEKQLMEARSEARSAESASDRLLQENEKLRAQISAVTTEMKAITQNAIVDRGQRASAGPGSPPGTDVPSQSASDTFAPAFPLTPAVSDEADTTPVSSCEVPEVPPSAVAPNPVDVNASNGLKTHRMPPTQTDLEDAIAKHHAIEREKVELAFGPNSVEKTASPGASQGILEPNHSSSETHSLSRESQSIPHRIIRRPSFLQRDADTRAI